ncbi:hypothetical protein BDP27DRAFT_1334801, partial [Rhodocollybia butyracea]
TTHPKVNFPELPEEIWSQIFRWTCDVNSPIPTGPKLLSFPVPVNKRVLRKRMVFCKTWHRIVLPCLLEAVAILDHVGFRCQGLSGILEKYSLGHLVERLDLNLQYFYFTEPLGSLVSLLRHCPNLRVLVVTLDEDFGTYGGYFGELLRCILALPNLHFFDFPWDHCGADFVVTLANSTIRATTFYTDTIIARLSALSQISMAEPYSLLSKFTTLDNQTSFENVTSFILDNTSLYRPCHPYLFQMARICRSLPRVKYVTIHTISVAKHNRYMAASFPLTTPSRPGSLQLPPSVHTLTFWSRQAKATTRAWCELCRTLSLIHGEGIEVIRFRTETVEDLRGRYTAYKAMNEILEAKGWRLEAGDLYV